MSVSSDNQFKASQPPPRGATESSSLENQTVGGQQIKVKQREVAQGTQGVQQVFKDQVDSAQTDSANGLRPLQFNDPGKPGEPSIPPSGPYKPEAVQRNEWLNSTFMVTIAVALTGVAMLNKEIHKAEGIWTVQALTNIWKSALSLASLIMAKAEKEAAMHMALAIGAVASLGVAVGGTALSISGKGMSTTAKNRLAELDEGITPPPTSSNALAGATPSVASNTTGKPSFTSRLKTQLGIDDPAPPPPPTTNKPPTPPKPTDAQRAQIENQSRVNAGGPEPPPKSANAKKVSADIKAKENQAILEKAAADRVTERQKMNELDARGENLHMAGMAMTQATPAVGQIIENMIQMYFKPEIAYIEQQIELERAMKELWQKSWDTALQGFNGAGQEIDAAMQNWTKEQDENTRAHMLKGG